jgi:hypothetical protein
LGKDVNKNLKIEVASTLQRGQQIHPTHSARQHYERAILQEQLLLLSSVTLSNISQLRLLEAVTQICDAYCLY